MSNDLQNITNQSLSSIITYFLEEQLALNDEKHPLLLVNLLQHQNIGSLQILEFNGLENHTFWRF